LPAELFGCLIQAVCGLLDLIALFRRAICYITGMSFFDELKRRIVFRVGLAYLVAAWVLLQVLDVVGEILELPAWGGKLILAIITAGFFVTVFVAWAYQLMPDGNRHKPGKDRGRSITARTGRKLNLVIIGLMAAAIAYLLFDKFYLDTRLADRNPLGPQSVEMPPARSDGALDIDSGIEPRIAVAPIKVHDNDPELAELAAAVGEDVASGLSRFSYLLVASNVADVTGAGDRAAYVLQGSLRRAGSTLRLTVQLINVSSGEQVWGESFDRVYDPLAILQIQDDLTDHVVASVADPYGALMRDLASKVTLLAPEDMTPYETVLRHFIYRQRIGAEDHLLTRSALERGVRIAPGNADVWAGLASIFAEEYKHDYNALPGSLDRALEAARKAVALEPDSASANFALAEVYYFRQDLGAFRAAAERAIELNPRDSDAMAMIGIMMGYGGDWTRSVELTTRAMELNGNHPGWYRFNTFFNAYRQGHYEEALAIVERISMPRYFADSYTRAITYAKLGRSEEAARALDDLLELWPGVTLRSLRESHLNKWFYAQPELADMVLEGLSEAGLESE
jgi:TolB-like protein/Tfp pilus assembly protein PilF